MLSGRYKTAISGLVLAVAVPALPAWSDTVAEFYDGRQVTVIVNSGSGGSNALYARTLGQFLGRHIPGQPTVVMQFMPGAGGTKGANFCYNVAPKDGTTLCHLLHSLVQAEQFRAVGVRYESDRFSWIGRTATVAGSILVWHTVPVKSLLDAREQEVLLGATGKSSENYTDPTMINHVLGTRLKPILGYAGGGELYLAMERGETHGMGGPLLSVVTGRPDWVEQGKIRFLVQIASQKHPMLPDVPLLESFAETEEARQMFRFMTARADLGRSLSGPPGIPEDRVEALRKAFMDTMGDPDFIREAEKRHLELLPASGDEVEQVVARLLATPPEVIDQAKSALGLE